MSKISELLPKAGIQTKTNDLFVTVDVEAGDIGTKNITRKELVNAIQQEDFTDINITDALNLMNQYGYICSYYQMVDTLCTQRSAEEMKKDNKMTLSTYPATVDTFVSHPTFVKNSAGMIIENQIVEYCSINRILEHECDTLLLLVQDISTTIEESGIRNEERQ